jgi:hypothetical protein
MLPSVRVGWASLPKYTPSEQGCSPNSPAEMPALRGDAVFPRLQIQIGKICHVRRCLAERMNTMQLNKVTSCGSRIACGVLLVGFLALSGLTSCSPKDSQKVGKPDADQQSHATVTPDDSDLLLRVRFAGTAALLADTNATYLTNIAALPESAALSRRIVERMATLPGRLLAPGSTNAALASNLTPVFSNLLHQGFALELRGNSNGVYSMILAAPNTALMPAQLQGALGSNPLDRSAVRSANGWTTWVVDTRTNLQPSTFNLQPSLSSAPAVLTVDMASTLLPDPIRRSVYGGFDQFSFTANPTPNGFKIRGQATYAADLPVLQGEVVVPTNLVSEPVVSFTMVREPDSWLTPDNPLRDYLPQPIPDVVWFWGGESSPYQFYVAVPFGSTNRFGSELAPKLTSKLEKLATATGTGPIVFEESTAEIQWGMVPFLAPRISLRTDGTTTFLEAYTFPAPDAGPGLTSALLDRTLGSTNTVVFDWEFTQARIDAWARLSQLALFLSSKQQLDASSCPWQWLQAAQKVLPGGGNMFTILSQTGSRELSLDRLAPLSFSSIELFWLANWLESEKFPDANFLTPGQSPFPVYESVPPLK